MRGSRQCRRVLARPSCSHDRLVFVFRRAGDDEPHLVLTSAPVQFEPMEEEEDDEEDEAEGRTGLSPTRD